MSLIAVSKRMVNDLVREVRTISYLLPPPLLEEFGLSKALEWYVDGLKKRNGIKIKSVISGDLERLPRGYQLAIFCILRQCLLNPDRHSGSQTARSLIEQRSERFFLEAHNIREKELRRPN